MNLKKITDVSHEDRFNALKDRVGDKPQHYINQLNKCSEDKRRERAKVFYELSNREGLTNTAQAIKREFPDIYASEEQIEQDKAAEAEKARLAEEKKEKARLEAEAKRPINILIANMEKTGKSPCYGLSDSEVDNLEEKLYEELTPGSGPADTQAGEMLRAWNDLMYRYYNDGDWFVTGEGWTGRTVFTPRAVSNMKYLTSHGAAQISFFYENSNSASEFVHKVNRMLLNQIVKKKLYKVQNYEDSRTYWKPTGRRRSY